MVDEGLLGDPFTGTDCPSRTPTSSGPTPLFVSTRDRPSDRSRYPVREGCKMRPALRRSRDPTPAVGQDPGSLVSGRVDPSTSRGASLTPHPSPRSSRPRWSGVPGTRDRTHVHRPRPITRDVSLKAGIQRAFKGALSPLRRPRAPHLLRSVTDIDPGRTWDDTRPRDPSPHCDGGVSPSGGRRGPPVSPSQVHPSLLGVVHTPTAKTSLRGLGGTLCVLFL